MDEELASTFVTTEVGETARLERWTSFMYRMFGHLDLEVECVPESKSSPWPQYVARVGISDAYVLCFKFNYTFDGDTSLFQHSTLDVFLEGAEGAKCISTLYASQLERWFRESDFEAEFVQSLCTTHMTFSRNVEYGNIHPQENDDGTFDFQLASEASAGYTSLDSMYDRLPPEIVPRVWVLGNPDKLYTNRQQIPAEATMSALRPEWRIDW